MDSWLVGVLRTGAGVAIVLAAWAGYVVGVAWLLEPLLEHDPPRAVPTAPACRAGYVKGTVDCDGILYNVQGGHRQYVGPLDGQAPVQVPKD
jgi:hypothetical protein